MELLLHIICFVVFILFYNYKSHRYVFYTLYVKDGFVSPWNQIL